MGMELSRRNNVRRVCVEASGGRVDNSESRWRVGRKLGDNFPPYCMFV